MEQVELRTISLDVDFPIAWCLGEQLATEVIDEPMLIAWHDGIKGEEHPAVPECQHQPGRLANAEGHGVCLRVDVYGEMYSLVFAESGTA